MFRFYSVLLFFFQFSVLHSQVVSNILVSQEQNNILVSYDLLVSTSCSISLQVSQDGGASWSSSLKSVKGDVGEKIVSGSHTITWFVLDEYNELRGNNIKFKVIADKTVEKAARIPREKNKAIGGPQYAVLSVLLPGMGDRIVNKQKNTWPLISGFYIGSIATAVYFKSKSNANYKLYHDVKYTPDGNYIKDLDRYYKIANDNNRNFNIMMGVAGSIWLVDVIYVAVKGTRNKNKNKFNSWQTFIYPNINFNANRPPGIQFSLIQKF